MRITQAAYARRRGVTRGAVAQRVQRAGGPIPTYGARHLIDPLEADRLWFATMTAAGFAQTAQAFAESQDAPPNATGASPSGTALASARADVMTIEAELRRLRLEERRGNLLERHATLAKFYAALRGVRDAWLAWPSRVGAELAAELGVEPAQLMIALERAVRRQLTELADVQLALAGGEASAHEGEDDAPGDERSPGARRDGGAGAPA